MYMSKIKTLRPGYYALQKTEGPGAVVSQVTVRVLLKGPRFSTVRSNHERSV